MKRALASAIGVLLAFSASSPLAWADGPDELYKAALVEAGSGNLLRAGELFAQAADEAPHPITHFSAAKAYLGAGAFVPAADHFARSLDLGLEEPDRTEAQRRLAELRTTLGGARVVGEGRARLGDGATLVLPATLHASANVAKLTVDRNGLSRSFDVVLERGQIIDFVVPSEPLPKPPPQTPPKPDPPASPRKAPSTSPTATTTHDVGWLVSGGTAGVLALGGVGVAIGMGVLANAKGVDYASSRARYLGAPTLAGHDALESLYDDARTLETGTNVAWGVAGATAAIGVAFLVVYWATGDDASTQTAIGADGVQIRF